MIAERIKVRCYRCSQLLAVASNKVGMVVSCPRCKAELLIPSPDSEPQGQEQPGSSVEGDLTKDGPETPGSHAQGAAVSSEAPSPELPSFLAEMDTGLPPEVAALRPEDLRVEAEFFQDLANRAEYPTILTSAPTSRESDVSAPFFIEPPQVPSAPGETTSAQVFPDVSSKPAEPTVATRGLGEVPPPLPAPQPGAVGPPIEIETPTIRPPGVEMRPLREVTLPASVVLAWSLFVLAGIAMSFVAGLMMGHFLWKHVP
jgi:phage FluMu protein Com